MSSLENNEYKFRNQAGDQTPRGLSNFPNWFSMLKGNAGKYNVRPTDLDCFLSNANNDSAIAIEFKPEGFGTLPYGQKASLMWFGKHPNKMCYGIYIEDKKWNERQTTPYTALELDEKYNITIFYQNKEYALEKSLNELNVAIAGWWATGTLKF